MLGNKQRIGAIAYEFTMAVIATRRGKSFNALISCARLYPKNDKIVMGGSQKWRLRSTIYANIKSEEPITKLKTNPTLLLNSEDMVKPSVLDRRYATIGPSKF